MGPGCSKHDHGRNRFSSAQPTSQIAAMGHDVNGQYSETADEQAPSRKAGASRRTCFTRALAQLPAYQPKPHIGRTRAELVEQPLSAVVRGRNYQDPPTNRGLAARLGRAS